jgi:N-acetylglutamate synthase-like GNAT family acetyltransferase
MAAGKGKNLIDFILAIEKDEKLLSVFLNIREPAHLHKFFQDHEFKEISKDDCKKIIKAENHRKALGMFGEIINAAELRKGY